MQTVYMKTVIVVNRDIFDTIHIQVCHNQKIVTVLMIRGFVFDNFAWCFELSLNKSLMNVYNCIVLFFFGQFIKKSGTLNNHILPTVNRVYVYFYLVCDNVAEGK